MGGDGECTLRSISGIKNPISISNAKMHCLWRWDSIVSLVSLRHSVNLTGKARLLAGSAVLVEHMVRRSLIDRLAGGLQEGLRFIAAFLARRFSSFLTLRMDALMFGKCFTSLEGNHTVVY